MEVNFFSSTIIQVAISIVISWALFALLCSMIHEIITKLKSERGRFFRNKIHEKLFDNSNNINWGLLLYNHSSIKLLTKSEKSPPTEINSKTFAEVLIDTVANAQAAKILKNSSSTQTTKYNNDLLNKLEFATTNLGQSDVIMMLRNALEKANLRGGESESIIYQSLVEEVKQWFDQFGERTSAWYKKISQKRLFFIGLLISILVNIDSIALFKYYESNPTARTEMVDFYTKNKFQLESLSAKYNDTTKKTTAIDSTFRNTIKKDISDLTKQIDSLNTSLDLPIGWDKSECISTPKNTNNHNVKIENESDVKKEKSALPCIIYKILGILISAFAASLGAPFWFDLLKRATTTTPSETIIKKQ
jgi:hypothetical protein